MMYLENSEKLPEVFRKSDKLKALSLEDLCKK